MSEPGSPEKRAIDGVEESDAKRVKSQADDAINGETASTENNDGESFGVNGGTVSESKLEAGVEEAKSEPDEEETPLARAQKAAERAKVVLPEGLDPETPDMLPKHQQRFLLSAIKAIKRLKDAGPFVVPVDPVKHGVPNYFDYIKMPMDLGTMETKLTNSEYKSVRGVADDFDLIVGNCIIFNGEDAHISKMALSIAQSFNKHLSNLAPHDEPDAKKRRSSTSTSRQQAADANAEAAAAATTSSVAASTTAAAASSGGINSAGSPALASSASPSAAASVKHMQAPGVPTIRRESAADGRPKREIHPPKPRDLPYGEPRPRNKKFAAELKFASQLIREFMSRKHEAIAYPFLLPVDPIAQGVPNYFEIIKEPMDLSTIQQKLNEALYYSGEEFEADVRLMFRNAYTFNPAGTPVHEVAKKLEEVFDKRWVEKPQPQAAQPLLLSSDESDFEEEYEELGLSNPAIEILEEQFAMIQQQLRRLKRDAVLEWRDKRGKKKGGSRGTTSGRRQSHAAGGVGGAFRGDYGSSSSATPSGNHHSGGPVAGHSRKASVAKQEVPQIITYEMKKELSEKITTLNEKRLRRVITIIQESMPHLKNSGQEEIELDMDQLEPATLRELYIYVVRGKEPDSAAVNGSHAATAAAASAAGGRPQKKKKSKPLTEDEQNRQIEEIQNKLRQFDQAREGTPAGSTSPSAFVGSGANDHSNSDDSSSEDDIDNAGADSDDSSSEEE